MDGDKYEDDKTIENLMNKYLAGEEIAEAEFKAALRRAVIANEIVPVLCGSALKNKGVQKMLDAVCDYLPSPVEVPELKGFDPDDEEKTIIRKPDDSEPFTALAFKIATDPYVGKLVFFRVYSGVLKSGSYVYNSSSDKKERIGRILMMHANHREEIGTVDTGTIAATSQNTHSRTAALPDRVMR